MLLASQLFPFLGNVMEGKLRVFVPIKIQTSFHFFPVPEFANFTLQWFAMNAVPWGFAVAWQTVLQPKPLPPDT